MNVHPSFQDLKKRRSPLYTMSEQNRQFELPAPNYVQGETLQPTAAVNRYPAAGRHVHFVAQIRELIEMNIDDESYGIDQLCRDAGASRSQIHNKLKKWTGLSTSYFIRSIRLQKARYLLVHSDLNITQVAYEVGFRAPSYFTRVFEKSFGICPKNFRNRWQQTHPAA